MSVLVLILEFWLPSRGPFARLVTSRESLYSSVFSIGNPLWQPTRRKSG